MAKNAGLGALHGKRAEHTAAGAQGEYHYHNQRESLLFIIAGEAAELVDITVTGKIAKEEKAGKKGVEVKLTLTDQEGNKYLLPKASKKSTVKAEDFVDKVVTVTGKGMKGPKGSVIKEIANIVEAAAAAVPAPEKKAE